jgi:hypothetical protein
VARERRILPGLGRTRASVSAESNTSDARSSQIAVIRRPVQRARASRRANRPVGSGSSAFASVRRYSSSLTIGRRKRRQMSRVNQSTVRRFIRSTPVHHAATTIGGAGVFPR